MRHRLIAAASAVLALVASTEASAAPVQQNRPATNSDHFSQVGGITVTIPPLAEAMAARASGAAGDWTIQTSGGGFLVDLPEVVENGSSGEDATGPEEPMDAPLAVYRSDLNRFTLSVASENGDVAMAPAAVIPGENLVQIKYGLPKPDSHSGTSPPLRVVFEGL